MGMAALIKHLRLHFDPDRAEVRDTPKAVEYIRRVAVDVQLFKRQWRMNESGRQLREPYCLMLRYAALLRKAIESQSHHARMSKFVLGPSRPDQEQLFVRATHTLAEVEAVAVNRMLCTHAVRRMGASDVNETMLARMLIWHYFDLFGGPPGPWIGDIAAVVAEEIGGGLKIGKERLQKAIKERSGN